MTRVYLADSLPEERSALRLMLLDLKMEVVGEAADWPITLTEAPGTHLDMLVVDWDLLPTDLGAKALEKLRMLCPNAIVIVLINHFDTNQQALAFVSADAFISTSEMPERVAERLRLAAASLYALTLTV